MIISQMAPFQRLGAGSIGLRFLPVILTAQVEIRCGSGFVSARVPLSGRCLRV